MSDVRDFSNPEEYGKLFDRQDESILDDALGGVEEAPAPKEPPPRRTLPPQGGLTPMITKLRNDIEALERKLETHRDTGAYAKKGADGSSYYDVTEQMDDQAKLAILHRKLTELKEQQRDGQREAGERAQSVRTVAQSFLQREGPKVDERYRKDVLTAFGQLYQQYDAAGEWAKPGYADRATLLRGFTSLLETAIGNAMRKHVMKSEGAGGAVTGFDPSDDPKPKANPDDGDDDFTNNLMYAFEKRESGSLSVAELKRREAAKAAARAGGAQ